jgi:hypothetical protein
LRADHLERSVRPFASGGGDAPLADVARLAAAEQDCCRFFSFALTVDERGVALEVRAPDDALSLVEALFGAEA